MGGSRHRRHMSYVALAFYGIALAVSRADAYSTLDTETVRDTPSDPSMDTTFEFHPPLDRETNRSLQTGIANESLAKAIANGLRIPSAPKIQKKTLSQPQLTSPEPLRVKIVPVPTKTKGQQQQQEKVRANSNTIKKKRSSNANKKRGNLKNKKRSHSNKKRITNNKKQQTNKNSNQRKKRNRTNVKLQQKTSKKRTGGRNPTKKRNVPKLRNANQRGGSKTRNGSTSRSSGTMKQQRSNNNNKMKNNMNQRYSSSTSSFLQSINEALNGNTNSNVNNYSSGKPVKYQPPSSFGWGSSSSQPEIIWDGGDHTATGVSGVLMPCACYQEPSWGGGSSVGGKAGKATGSSSMYGKSGKEPNCLCLVSGLLPEPEVPTTTFMPTYFPTYYPTELPTYFPSFFPTESGDGMYVPISNTLFFFCNHVTHIDFYFWYDLFFTEKGMGIQ